MAVPMLGEHPVEMGVDDVAKPKILARLRADPDYQRLFRKRSPTLSGPMTFVEIVKAIASFERGIVSFSSRAMTCTSRASQSSRPRSKPGMIFSSAKRGNAVSIVMAVPILTINSLTPRVAR